MDPGDGIEAWGDRRGGGQGRGAGLGVGGEGRGMSGLGQIGKRRGDGRQAGILRLSGGQATPCASISCQAIKERVWESRLQGARESMGARLSVYIRT